MKKKCIELFPILYEHIRSVYVKNAELLDSTILNIISYIRQPNNNDRGQGFLSIGRMASTVDREFFIKHVENVLRLI